jgi:hypothetical protein
VIKIEDLEFASQWVLVDEYSNDSYVIADKPGDSDSEVEARLDCILTTHHILQECVKKAPIGIDKIINELNYAQLELCNKALGLVANKDLLKEAIKIAQTKGRITNAAIDILMDKKGALKAWWRGNAAQTVCVMKNNVVKYKSISNIVEKLSPTNFYISNGCLKVKNNGH